MINYDGSDPGLWPRREIQSCDQLSYTDKILCGGFN